MSSHGTRSRSLYGKRIITEKTNPKKGMGDSNIYGNAVIGGQLTVSESHPMNRSDGSYRSGGPFYTSRVSESLSHGYVRDAYMPGSGRYYTGPVYSGPPSKLDCETIGYKNILGKFGDKNESQLLKDGTNAIAYDNPVNPASNLGETLGEIIVDKRISVPGIQAWKAKTNFLKGIGSEYLSYQFGWHPLVEEVHNVANAARFHRDIMNNYHKGEGSDTHRRFDFPSERTAKTLPATDSFPAFPNGGWVSSLPHKRQISLVRETKKWFEGCFTYGLPSRSDSWKKSLGFGSQADQLFGLALSPEVLWELTPWSWAVDWFSNANEVITNVTNFGLAGLVLRYGFIMCETKEIVTATGSGAYYLRENGNELTNNQHSGGYTASLETVTKVRYPAGPFGFSIGWEGLSPTQLAITAALGITRLL